MKPLRDRFLLLAVLALGAGVPARAQSPAPPPYSLPWLLRPAAAGTVVRLDTTFARFDGPGSTDAGTLVESLIASYRVTPRLAPVARLTWIRHSPGGVAPPGTATSNPLLGASYVRPMPKGWRLSGFAATTIPIGSGGGDGPDPRAAAAIARAVPARSAMDNALFAVNYWTLIGGAGAARVTPRVTLQAEATVLQLFRVRGPGTQDARRTNLTVGVHAGRFLGKRLSVGAELRLQRWLTGAAPVRADSRARETVTAAVGPRLHFRLGTRWLRPGVSYTWALDDPLRGQGYGIVQLDVPLAF